MNTARLAPARPRGGNGKAHEAWRATLSPGTPLRGWARAGLSLIRRRYLGAEPRKQLWTWFLPNPVVSGREQPEQTQSACEASVNRGANIMLVEHDCDARERLRLWLQ